MRQAEFELEIQVHGHPIREYRHQGRTYIEGRRGSEYKLHIRNHSPNRVLAVATVDGLSIMDGSDGGYDGEGYVLDAHQSICVPGWRLDNEQVAKFTFGSKPSSYASQTGRPKNVGVIGCAIFREVKPPAPTVIYRDRWVYPWPYHRWRCSWDTDYPEITWTNSLSDDDYVLRGSTTADPCMASNAVATVNCSMTVEPQSIGTEFGRAAEHNVTTVGFAREASPATVFEVWYDDRAGLEARGIDLRGRLKVARPTAFPRSRGCQPPRGWRP